MIERAGAGVDGSCGGKGMITPRAPQCTSVCVCECVQMVCIGQFAVRVRTCKHWCGGKVGTGSEKSRLLLRSSRCSNGIAKGEIRDGTTCIRVCVCVCVYDRSATCAFDPEQRLGSGHHPSQMSNHVAICILRSTDHIISISHIEPNQTQTQHTQP